MVDEIQEAEAGGRHPIRTLLKLLVVAGFVYTVGRFVARKKDEYAGLTESQARERLVDKMAPRLGDDTAGEIADQVIPKLRDRGLIKADESEEAAEETEQVDQEMADTAEEKVEEPGDEVTEAVDSVVKD